MTDRGQIRPPIGGIKVVPTNGVRFDADATAKLETGVFSAGVIATTSEFTYASRFKMLTDGEDSNWGIGVFCHQATQWRGLRVQGANTGIITIMMTAGGFEKFTTIDTFTAAYDVWHTLLISGKTGTGMVAYLDDVKVEDSAWSTAGDSALATLASSSNFGVFDPNMEMSRIYTDLTHETDFRVEANRRKFFLADGTPVEIDVTGLGGAPYVYFGDGQLAYQWNRGENKVFFSEAFSVTSGAVTDV